MKSSITQIERRFDIPSSLIGVIDGSFEMGMCSYTEQRKKMEMSGFMPLSVSL